MGKQEKLPIHDSILRSWTGHTKQGAGSEINGVGVFIETYEDLIRIRDNARDHIKSKYRHLEGVNIELSFNGKILSSSDEIRQDKSHNFIKKADYKAFCRKAENENCENQKVTDDIAKEWQKEINTKIMNLLQEYDIKSNNEYQFRISDANPYDGIFEIKIIHDVLKALKSSNSQPDN